MKLELPTTHNNRTVANRNNHCRLLDYPKKIIGNELVSLYYNIMFLVHLNKYR